MTYGHGHKQIPGGVLLILAIVAAAAIGFSATGGDKSVNSDVNPNADIGQGGGSNSQPVAAETETPDVEAMTKTASTEPRLLEKIGPFDLSLLIRGAAPFDKDASFNYKEKKIEIEDCVIRIETNPSTGPSVFVNRKESWSASNNDFCVLILLRDKNGEIEKSLCKPDEPSELAVLNSIYEFKNTGDYYYSKTSMMNGVVTETKFAISQRGAVLGSPWENAETWEVLVYV